MKKRILILGAVFFALSLTAFDYIRWKDGGPLCPAACSGASPLEATSDVQMIDFDFVYSIDPRFLSTITREDLSGAKTIIDIVSPKDEDRIESYHNIALSTFCEDREKEIKAKADNEVLTDAQIRLLRSMDYGKGFYITGNIKKRDTDGGQLVKDTLVRYMSVSPNQPASYKTGKDVLINYLREHSKEEIAIARKDHIKPGKISFLVTKNGDIDDVQLTYGSGYASIDEKMLELIREIPGSWEAATNAKGEKVDQELVFFFGLMEC